MLRFAEPRATGAVGMSPEGGAIAAVFVGDFSVNAAGTAADGDTAAFRNCFTAGAGGTDGAGVATDACLAFGGADCPALTADWDARSVSACVRGVFPRRERAGTGAAAGDGAIPASESAEARAAGAVSAPRSAALAAASAGASCAFATRGLTAGVSEPATSSMLD